MDVDYDEISEALGEAPRILRCGAVRGDRVHRVRLGDPRGHRTVMFANPEDAAA